MALMKVSAVLLSILLLVHGNPAHLQELYGTPSLHEGHDHDHDHGHGHGHSDSSGNVRPVTSGTNLGLGAEPSVGSGSLGRSVSDDSSVFAGTNSGGSLFSGVDSTNINNQSIQDGSMHADSSLVKIVNSNLHSNLHDHASELSGEFGSAADTGTNIELEPSSDDSVLVFQDDINSAEVTITREITIDVFTTFINVFYNTVPVTITEFVKTTIIQPTLQVLSTPVDDHVFVSTAPVTRTDTVTVTDTNTAFQCATEVSTDLYTVTHLVYDIQQQLITSTVVQTKVYRPTVVSTRIDTEYDTQTVIVTATNTVVVDAESSFAGPVINSETTLSESNFPPPSAVNLFPSFADGAPLSSLSRNRERQLLQQRRKFLEEQASLIALQRQQLESLHPDSRNSNYRYY